MLTRNNITTLALALAGVGLCAFSGPRLKDDGGFVYDPNPLGIKRSPYGQVIAMAIQTPIDADWHGGIEIHDHAPGESCSECEGHGDSHTDHSHHDHGCSHDGCSHDHHAHAEHTDCESGECDHDHGHHHDHAASDSHEHIAEGGCSDPECHDHHAEEPAESTTRKLTLLSKLNQAVSKRTNPNPPTTAHRLYLRREIEKKLKFAYDLDPSHYANYNSYNLFLTQSTLGTHGLPQDEITRMVEKLADHTIRYCLAEEHDPRPALTATSAAYNVLERMLTIENEQNTTERMREQLEIMDFCMRRHFTLLDAAVNDGSFALFSPMRQDEILKRSQFAVRLRESALEAIVRREQPETSTAGAS